jgi:hypothetical protein
MTYACPGWEFAADNHLLKLQRLQNEVLRTIGNFPRRTPVRDFHMANISSGQVLERSIHGNPYLNQSRGF